MEELEVENLEEIDHVLDELLDQMPANEKSALLQEAKESNSLQAENLLAEISNKNSSPSFAEVLEGEELEVLKEDEGPLLTEEERSFFFEQTQEAPVSETHFVDDFMNSEVVDVQSIDENQEIYEEVILSPVLQDTRRLYFMCLGGLCLLFGLICILCYFQKHTQDLILANKVSIQAISKSSMSSKFLSKSMVHQRQEILLKLNSSLSTKEEKALCNFFLASFAYQEGDMKAGRKFMLEGVKLRDDK